MNRRVAFSSVLALALFGLTTIGPLLAPDIALTDDHVYGYDPGPVMALAECAVVLDQATMCQAGDSAGANHYRSHRRTFHASDYASIDAGY
jgi:hypothetical protein